jgi:transcription antitermination protein NusB
MLSRRLMRAIVMQSLYAFFQSDNDRVEAAEKALLERIDKIKMLFTYQLFVLIEFIKFSREKTEDAKHKHIPSKEELNPNTRLIDSTLIRQIEKNKQYTESINKYKFSLTEEKELFINIYQTIRKSKEYNKYLNNSNNYENDKEYIIKIFKKHISKNSTLKSLCEERNLYWADDYDFVSSELIKVIKSYSEDFDENYQIIKEKENFKEDIDFILTLFRKTIIHNEEYEKMISVIIKNWEKERVAQIDMLLMKMAICEMLNFSEIPLKVSLNEYIEIAKLYSTPKSSTFINGILDKLLDSFKKENKILKTGRGML